METKTITLEKTFEIPDYNALLVKNNEKLAILNENNDVLLKAIEVKANTVLAQITKYITEVVMPVFNCESTISCSFVEVERNQNSRSVDIYYCNGCAPCSLMRVYPDKTTKLFIDENDLEIIIKLVKNWEETKHYINVDVQKIINHDLKPIVERNNILNKVVSMLDNFQV